MHRSLLTVALIGLLAPAGPAPAGGLDGYDALLRQHAREGRVDYATLKDDARLSDFVRCLAAPAELATAQERLACWLNAYNAFVLSGICANWRLKRVVDVDGFFNAVPYTLHGRKLSLDALMEGLLRPQKDPRIHAALCTGCLGSPPLRPEAYQAARLDEQLTDQARQWVNGGRSIRLNRTDGKLELPLVFKWYAPDFEPVGGATAFVRKYLAEPEDQRWVAAGDYQIVYIPFDWTCNAKPE